jgi:hypothetical protein
MSFATLNEDVALEIFYAFRIMDRDGDGLYTLIQVSTMWRDLIVHSPILWRYVYLDDSKSDWEERLGVSLALSQQLPLHVSLRVPFEFMGSLKYFVSRWKTLEIRLSNNEGIGDIAEAILQLLERDDQKGAVLETLEEIRWISPNGAQFNPPMGLPQRFRTHIFDRWYLNLIHPDNDEPLRLSGKRLVKSLLINHQQYAGTDFRPNSSTVIRILSHYRHISHLHLTLKELFWDSKLGVETLYFPNLEECSLIKQVYHGASEFVSGKLGADRFLKVFKAKKLQILSLGDEHLALKGCLAFILPAKFPRLRTLSLTILWSPKKRLEQRVVDPTAWSKPIDLRSEQTTVRKKPGIVPFQLNNNEPHDEMSRKSLQVPTIYELHLEASDIYNKTTWETFIGDILTVAGYYKQLRLKDPSSTLGSPRNQDVLSRFLNLEKLEFVGRISGPPEICDNTLITLPKLRIVTIVATGVESEFPSPRARILPFKAPALEELTLNTWDAYSRPRNIWMGISDLVAPNRHFPGRNFTFDHYSAHREVTLINITTLRCNMETAVFLTPFTPNLTTLSLKQDYSTNKRNEECADLMKKLARSTTLISMNFSEWGSNTFLTEKRRTLLEQRERPDNPIPLAQPLRHLSIPGYLTGLYYQTYCVCFTIIILSLK